jgi:hypothetical protein
MVSISVIDTGSAANNGRGDPLRSAMQKINENFQKLFRPREIPVTATTKTLTLTDAQTIQTCTNGSAQTITIPLNANEPFVVGDTIVFERHGAGIVSVIGAEGVTINGIAEEGGNESAVIIAERWRGGYIRKTAADAWIAVGF